MEIQSIANRLYELCKAGDWEQAQNELYADHCKSIEPPNAPPPHEVQGIDAIKEKGVQFNEMVEEMHGGYVNEPKVFGNFIAMEMGMDVTMKGMGRMNMSEMCIYEVKDGKIISEQFFF